MRQVLSAGAAFLALLTVAGPVRAEEAGDQTAALRQIAGILDYIGGDYRGAVDATGAILNPGEYEEQLSLVADADALAAEAGLASEDALRRDLAQLREALRARRPPTRISERCRQAKARIARDHGVVLAPTVPPSRQRGTELYAAQGCGTCHGADGDADTPAARELDPPPADFLDPERVAAVSPHRAFYAISFGVEGTGMAGYGHLTDAERWDLAFYVLSLRHQDAELARGRAVLAALEGDIPDTPAALAGATDEEMPARTQFTIYDGSA